MTAVRSAFSLFLVLVFMAAWPVEMVAEVTRVRIDRREPFAEGRAFGRTGAYEIVEGRLFFEFDPVAPANQRIADLKLAPVNARGRVECWQDFWLLAPVDPGKGNGCLLYDVHNRGNKLALWTFNDGERSNDPTSAEHAGNGFLLREGYAVLSTGWCGDIVADDTHRLLAGLPIAVGPGGEPVTGRNYVEISVDAKVLSQPFFGSPWGTSAAYPSTSLDNAEATLTMRPRRSEPPVEIPRDAWAFARWEEGKVVPDPSSLYVKEGLRPGWLYELVYTARDPRVAGLGLAGLRDAVSHFRHAGADNPLGGAIDRAIVFGVSQSGRLVHHFLHDGFNVDAADRMVFDGALIHVAGAGKGLFNCRFGMATVYGTAHRGNLSPADVFPFAPVAVTDPVTGETGDSLARLRAKKAVPRIFFVQTATEYWNRAASLLHTDVEGQADLEMDPAVRIYFIAGTQHLDGGPTDPGNNRYPRNPVRHRGPVLRALLTGMDRWITGEAEPPESRYPRIADGTLVGLEAFRDQFPAVPGKELPEMLNRPLRLDPGPRWRGEGIADEVPPKVGTAYVTLVPAVDADGNERAGIRLPEIAVPLATCLGWNLRADLPGVLSDLDGGYWEFSRSRTEREKTGDPRPSVAERYPSRSDYLSQVSETLLGLRAGGYLLDEDVTRLLERAREVEVD
jgi:hypothetical protein